MDEKKQKSIATILINWNGYKDTKECVQSLLKVDYPTGFHQIIVVDNASTDDSLELLKREFKDNVHFIENDRNLGFTGANNKGFEYALKHGFDYVFVLNNDTTVDRNIFGAFLKFLDENKAKNVGILSPKIYNYYKPTMIESRGGILDIIKGRNYPIDYGVIETFPSSKKDLPAEISFATGSAMFMRTSLLKIIGFFDDEYFAYYEDQDFCFKAMKKGFRIYYCPGAKVWHKVSASTGGYKNPTAISLSTKNRIKFVIKNGSFSQKAFFFLYFLFYYAPTFSAWSISNLEFMRVRAFWRALLSYVFPFVKMLDIEPVNKGFLRIGINARYIQRPITGIERYTVELIKNLGNMGAKDSFTLFFNKHEPIPKMDLPQNFTNYVSRFPTKSVTMRILWEQFNLYFEIKRKRIDVFHGPSFVVPIIKPNKCRYITTIHDLSWFYYPESFTFFNRLFFRLFLPTSIRKSDMVIADSESTKKDIIKFFGTDPGKVKVIYLGIDKGFCKPFNKKKEEDVLAKYRLPDDYLLSIGSLLPRKNVINIIRAFHNLRKKGLKEKLVIIGREAWLYEKIFSAIKDFEMEKDVIFTGYVDDRDLPYLYRRAKLLLFPSLYEGFGLPILEAMVCGCPVITSNVSSMPEVAGDAALFVNPKNIMEIASATERMLNENKLRISLIEKGYKQVKRFSWEDTAKETLEIYRTQTSK